MTKDEVIMALDNATRKCDIHGEMLALERLARLEAQPAPVQELDYKVAIGEWLDKTEWLQEMVSSGHLGSRYLGMHRADVLRDLAYPNTVTGKAPPQREWVGLTLADREELRDQFEDWNYPAILVDVISAKLKEKNHGH